MTLLRYLAFLTASTVLCWVSWLLVLLRVNPETSGPWAPFFFYLTGFFALAGTAALVGYLVRAAFNRQELPYRTVAVSFRQGLLLAAVAVGCLALQGGRLLSWWNLGLVILVAAAVEAVARLGGGRPSGEQT